MSRRLALAASTALFAVATTAFAEPKLLDDREMRAVYGRADNSVQVQVPTGLLPGGSNGPAGQLANELLKGAKVSLIDEAHFTAALAAVASQPVHLADYDGRPVTQIEITAEPVSMTFEAGSFLASLAGGTTLHGPSMGTISLNNVDARGTTLWIYGH